MKYLKNNIPTIIHHCFIIFFALLIAFLIRVEVGKYISYKVPFLTFYPAMVLIALQTSLPYAVLGFFISCVLANFFFTIPYKFTPLFNSPEPIILLIGYGIGVGCIIIVAELFKNEIRNRESRENQLKQSEEKLKGFAQALEERVKLRTHQLEKQTLQLRLLANELSGMEQKERKRFAKLLHDQLQQSLVACKMQLDMMQRYPDKMDHEDLANAKEYIEKAIDEARSLTTELRPPALYEGGLIPALRFLAKKFEQQHHFIVHLDADPKGEPKSDITKWVLYQAIQELLLNAVKYANVKECFISMVSSDHDDIHIRVFDRGRGFNIKSIERQFNGGFGLFSIRERIHALGGEFKIESSIGQGATFEISVPHLYVPELEELEVSKEREKTLLIKEVIDELTDSTSIRVLIADDHSIIREGISNMINNAVSLKVIGEAENGEEAVTKARSLRPDVIVMDLNMPRLNGIEATRIIRHEFPDTKIIGLSVQNEEELAQSMKDAGASAFFYKGGDPEKLIETIKNCVSTPSPI
jgi:signal transduction histidine kinase/CheY-like chemotaxis protein